MSDVLRRPLSGAWLTRHGTLAALLVLLLVNAAITPHFLAWQTLSVNATQVATTVIVATGMTLVIATGGIDLSVGSLMAIAGTIAPMIFGRGLGALGDALAIILPILVAGAFGWINGLFVTALRIQPIIATLILFIAGRGIAQVATNGNLQPFTEPGFQWIGLGAVARIPVQVMVMAVVVAVAAWAVRRTVWGRQVLAVGGNEQAATLAGMPVGRVKRSVYVVSGLCAGIAGLVTVAINSSSDANTVGLGMELDAIASVAVGGTPLSGGRAHVWGTLVGALVIQLVQYMLLANGVPDAAALVVKAGLIVAAVALQGGFRRR